MQKITLSEVDAVIRHRYPQQNSTIVKVLEQFENTNRLTGKFPVSVHEEQEEEQEVKGQRCTSVCQTASKIKCVCSCDRRNHGVKSFVKIDQFFDDNDGHIQE